MNILGSAFGTRLVLAFLRRQFDRAIELLLRSVNAPDVPRVTRASDRIDLGRFQLLTGDPEGRANVEQGRAELIALRNKGDTAPDNSANLIMAEALLGNRPAVEHEAEGLLREIGPDRWELPRAQVSVARAY
jgi:hypothetical protein